MNKLVINTGLAAAITLVSISLYNDYDPFFEPIELTEAAKICQADLVACVQRNSTSPKSENDDTPTVERAPLAVISNPETKESPAPILEPLTNIPADIEEPQTFSADNIYEILDVVVYDDLEFSRAEQLKTCIADHMPINLSNQFSLYENNGEVVTGTISMQVPISQIPELMMHADSLQRSGVAENIMITLGDAPDDTPGSFKPDLRHLTLDISTSYTDEENKEVVLGYDGYTSYTPAGRVVRFDEGTNVLGKQSKSDDVDFGDALKAVNAAFNDLALSITRDVGTCYYPDGAQQMGKYLPRISELQTLSR